jgi:hypothetical protein
MTSLLSGDRRWPRGEHTLVVLKTAMHGVASNWRKRSKNGAVDWHVAVEETEDEDPEIATAVKSVSAIEHVTPVEIASAKGELEAIQRAVAGDEDLEFVLLAWAEGMLGKEAAQELGFDMKKYEAARKRLDRKLKPIEAMRNEKS